MKRFIISGIVVIVIALASFFMLGQIKHSVSDPKGTMDYDCSDFPTRDEAQKFYLNHGGPDVDPYGLDKDHDGQACKNNPIYKKLAHGSSN